MILRMSAVTPFWLRGLGFGVLCVTAGPLVKYRYCTNLPENAIALSGTGRFRAGESGESLVWRGKRNA